ncbi:hypothetical protein JX265_006558 [Neoarthrinium moseri]|uniref:Uncharacterized protein n=1 Tax=Neoarthrinium moseri TaxID=1658444 RepID=A0A9P9WLX8_9PEZI|nr:hypothetical protein JX265_006558 [Neoarthrinium moseri]
MAPTTQPSDFDVFSDTSLDTTSGADQSSVDLGSNKFAALRSISVSNTQNSQSRQPGAGRAVESLAAELKKLHIGEPHEISHFKGKANAKPQTGTRLAQTAVAHSNFEVLETVPEDENHNPSGSAAVSVSDNSQHYIELSGKIFAIDLAYHARLFLATLTLRLEANNYAQHPLALAARNLPSAQDQLLKHREGDFEWVLTFKIPKQPRKHSESTTAGRATSGKTTKVFFGCNLIPSTAPSEGRTGDKGDLSQPTYTLLITPLENSPELETATESASGGDDMALARSEVGHVTPVKAFHSQPQVRIEEVSPASGQVPEGDSFVEIITSRTPQRPAARIEDSFEAIDNLEEQLEAFNVAAHVSNVASHDAERLPTRANGPASSSNAQHETKHSTPQPRKPSAGAGNSAGLKRSPSVRISPSMAHRDSPKHKLDSPKLKVEDKPLVQAPPRKPTNKGLTSLLPPKQLAKSSRPSTVPTFELPGEAVARRLKEQREARLSMGPKAQPPQASSNPMLRRTKSAKPPTRPTFELPGEAISRRKREEREAKLRAQEEEERKRREFKAKPIRAAPAPSSAVRGTITSRARQNNGALPENIALQTSQTPNKRASLVVSREPLSSTNNQSQPRGRLLAANSSEASRATSTSTGSISGKRSSVSIEDVQQQRLRGKEVLQRDSMYSKDREREKREREALARLAREQAAERSRLLSRQWAEKQKRKRMTIGSINDAVASSS